MWVIQRGKVIKVSNCYHASSVGTSRLNTHILPKIFAYASLRDGRAVAAFTKCQKETPTILLLWGSFRSKGDESETCQIRGPMSYGPSINIKVKHTMNTASIICYLLSTGPQRQQSLSLHMSCLFTPIQYAMATIATISINQSIIILLSQMMPLLWEPSQLQRCLLQNILCFSLILLVR